MANINSLLDQLDRRDKMLRKKIEKALVKAANTIFLPIYYEGALFLSTGTDRISAAGVAARGSHQSPDETTLAFLYLDISNQNGLIPGFYSVRIHSDLEGGFMPNADLIDLDGNYVQNVDLFSKSPYKEFVGESEPRMVLGPVFESIARKGDYVLLNGKMANGTEFVLSLEAWI